MHFSKVLLALSALALPFITACDSNNDVVEPDVYAKTGDFHIAFADGTGNPSATYVQGVSTLAEGNIRPIGNQLESARTARIFASQDGRYIWSLNYTVGTIEKLEYFGKDQYRQVGRIDASIPMASRTVRFTKLTDQLGSVHNIATPAPKVTNPDDISTYQGHEMIVSIGFLNLETMQWIGTPNTNIPVAFDPALAKQGYYVSRIDAPVIAGGKIYYATAMSKYNVNTGKAELTDKAATLVLDYPALTNARFVLHNSVAGSSSGYRTPTQFANEQGEILQMITASNVNAASTTDRVRIVKLVNGHYTDYVFDLSAALGGKGTHSNGFFYVGNGIAYVPYEDLSTASHTAGVDPNGRETKSRSWKLARVDLNKKTAVDLQVPDGLWLTQYQNSVVRDGKFYIALSPVGQPGHIYAFDIKSESPVGTKGATIDGQGVNQYYVGIY